MTKQAGGISSSPVARGLDPVQLYALLCVLGTLLPLSQFIPWLASHGFDLLLLVREATQAPIAAFAWADVLVSAMVTMLFIVLEGRRLGIKQLWVPLLGLCAVGVSLGFPLFLMLRERHLRAAT